MKCDGCPGGVLEGQVGSDDEGQEGQTGGSEGSGRAGARCQSSSTAKLFTQPSLTAASTPIEQLFLTLSTFGWKHC